MSELRSDPRLRRIEWHDLRTLTTRQKATELLISMPWLLLSVGLFQIGWLALAVPASFMFFLTGLRQAHGAQHYTLGVPRTAQDIVLAVLSVLMLSSLHALQATPMQHHRHAMEDDDLESATARMPWWKAILSGPWFILALNREGYRLARPAKRVWIQVELLAILGYLAVVFAWGPVGLRHFAIAMAVGECLTGFFAVWTVHHDVDPDRQLARTQRGWWKTALTYQMFYHVEHHLFPAVPTARLPELAERIDESVPHLREHQVY
ncbi:MAG: fatty acid desaturase family protein [Gemmatimonadota bacterium]